MEDTARLDEGYPRPSHFLNTREFSQLYLGRPSAANSPSRAAKFNHNEASSSLLRLPLPAQDMVPEMQHSTSRPHSSSGRDVRSGETAALTRRTRSSKPPQRHLRTQKQLNMYSPQARNTSAAGRRTQRARLSRSQLLRQEVRATRSPRSEVPIDALYSLFAPASHPTHSGSRLRDALQRSAERAVVATPLRAATASPSAPVEGTGPEMSAGSAADAQELRRRVVFLEEKLSHTSMQLADVRRDQRVAQVHDLRVELQVARSECCRLRALAKGCGAPSRAVSPSHVGDTSAGRAEATRTSVVATTEADESTCAALADTRRRNRELEKRIVQLVDQGGVLESRLQEAEKKVRQLSTLYSEALSSRAHAVGRMEQLESEAAALKKEVQVLQALPQKVLRVQRELDEARGQVIEADRVAERYKQMLGALSEASPESIHNIAAERDRLLTLLQHQKKTEAALRTALEAQQRAHSHREASAATLTAADAAALKRDREQQYEQQIQQLLHQVTELKQTLTAERAATERTLANMNQAKEEDLVERLLMAKPAPHTPQLEAQRSDADVGGSEAALTSQSPSVTVSAVAPAIHAVTHTTPPSPPLPPMVGPESSVHDRDAEFASSATSISSSSPTSTSISATVESASVASIESAEEERVMTGNMEGEEDDAVAGMPASTVSSNSTPQKSSAAVSEVEYTPPEEKTVVQEESLAPVTPLPSLPPATALVSVPAVVTTEEYALGSTSPQPSGDTLSAALHQAAVDGAETPAVPLPEQRTNTTPVVDGASSSSSVTSSHSPPSPGPVAAVPDTMRTPPHPDSQPDASVVEPSQKRSNTEDDSAPMTVAATASGVNKASAAADTAQFTSETVDVDEGPETTTDRVATPVSNTADTPPDSFSLATDPRVDDRVTAVGSAPDAVQLPPVLSSLPALRVSSPPPAPQAARSPILTAYTARAPLFSGEGMHMGLQTTPEPLEAYSHQTSYALAHQYSGNASFGVSGDQYQRAQQLLYGANTSASVPSADAVRLHEEEKSDGSASLRPSESASVSPRNGVADAVGAVDKTPPTTALGSASAPKTLEAVKLTEVSPNAASQLHAKSLSLEQSPISHDDRDYTRFSGVNLETAKTPSLAEEGDVTGTVLAADGELPVEAPSAPAVAVATTTLTAPSAPSVAPPPPTAAVVLPLNAASGPAVVPPPPVAFFGVPVVAPNQVGASSSSVSSSAPTASQSSSDASSESSHAPLTDAETALLAPPSENAAPTQEADVEVREHAAETPAEVTASTWAPPPPPVVSVPVPPPTALPSAGTPRGDGDNRLADPGAAEELDNEAEGQKAVSGDHDAVIAASA